MKDEYTEKIVALFVIAIAIAAMAYTIEHTAGRFLRPILGISVLLGIVFTAAYIEKILLASKKVHGQGIHAARKQNKSSPEAEGPGQTRSQSRYDENAKASSDNDQSFSGNSSDLRERMDLHWCYVLLGVSSSSSIEEIRAAYLRKAKSQHPDRSGDEDIMRSLNEAYSLLKRSHNSHDNLSA